MPKGPTNSKLTASTEALPILFFDGDCGLCTRSVRFLMRRDRAQRLRFAPLQGETAAALLEPKLRKSLSTVVYHRDSAPWLTRSDAVLHALIDTRSAWRYLARLALVVPRAWRDWIYDRIAQNRHRFLPKKACPLPTAQERSRILP
ncbi:MAG: thiol-disulfide oxidoreductase DCC family protein [Opitutales bacterium]